MVKINVTDVTKFIFKVTLCHVQFNWINMKKKQKGCYNGYPQRNLSSLKKSQPQQGSYIGKKKQ